MRAANGKQQQHTLYDMASTAMMSMHLVNDEYMVNESYLQ
jgi:hypothetical protein